MAASGIVNVGGFVASLTTVLAIGTVLDAINTGGPASYSLGAFRVAFCVQYPVWALGLWGVFRARRALRAQRGIVLDPFPAAVLRKARRR